MSTSITAPISASSPGFTGTSKFASSLQQVLGRAVGIAALPLQSLNAHLNELGTRQSALQGLDSAFSGLQNAVTSLARTAQSNILSSSVSDGGVVNATIGADAAPGEYSVEVVSLGSYSTGFSMAGRTAISDPSTQGLDGAVSFTLTSGSSVTEITAASSSLSDLVRAINEKASGAVQATIVNAGSAGSPDYRLSLRAVKLGTDSISLSSTNTVDLIASRSVGSLATYKVNGVATAINSDSRAISLAPGLSATLAGESAPGKPATITVSHDATGLASALNSFARAYNSATDTLAQQHGTSAGALEGDSLVWALGGALRQLGTYTNGSAAGSLAAFGVSLDKAGHLSVDTAAFQTAATKDFPTLLATLGDADKGGFLKAATASVASAEDPVTGSIKAGKAEVTAQITSQQKKIAAEQDRLVQLQDHFTAQIARADAAIARLESQVSYVSGLFAQYTGYNSNNQNNGLPTP